MTPMPCPRRTAFLQQRWDRIGLGVRLAYNPWHAPVIRCYLEAGAHYVRCGGADETSVQQRMLTVLLQTADDSALPWAWRAACHEYTVFPLARLATLARLGQAAEPGPWQQRVDAVATRLAACRPGTGAHPQPG